MKYFFRILGLLFLLLIVVVFLNYPKLNIISGYAAKNMASSVFVAGRTAGTVAENDNHVPLIRFAETKLDSAGHAAIATVYGLKPRKAKCREGLGCYLVSNTQSAPRIFYKPQRHITRVALPFPYGDEEAADTLFGNVDYTALGQAMDHAFSHNDVQKTRTVLVVYRDHIIAEKYAGGIGRETPVLGWSMTKSILATLYGILQFKGKMEVADYRPFRENRDSAEVDSRENITVDNLLRMQSGLAWDEDYTTISDVTRMLFLDADMTGAQSGKPIVAAPGEVWNYSSGTTNYLSGVLRKQFSTYQAYLDFPYKSLIDKIGMHSMLLEADMAGNYVASSYGWADTRDWARFGLLYLHRGNWNGTQIFEPGWVDYVTTPTPGSEGTYGAHFWLNSQGKYPGVPQDLYSANGYQGQYVFIIPSKDLVVVRTGLAEDPDFDVNTFLREITGAIR